MTTDLAAARAECERLRAALEACANDGCYMMKDLKTCADQSPIAVLIETGIEKPGAIYATDSWCPTCIAKAALTSGKGQTP